jgi:hypothetical protein
MPLTIDQQLASAAAFEILAATPDVTNTGNTVVTGGNVGVYPAAAIIGFPPGVIASPGVKHAADTIAGTAQTDAMAAYTNFNNMAGAITEPGDLGGLTLGPGLYAPVGAIIGITGTLTLDGQGNPNAQFIFQIPAALTTASGPGASTVKLINGAQAGNVIWLVQSAATLGTYSVFMGDIIAYATVALMHAAAITGRAISLTAAVTMDDNSATLPTYVNPIPVPPFPVTTSSVPVTVSLTELCFPDITGRCIRAWGLVTLTPGGYVVGGIPFGLFNFLDVRTVDVNGILKCDVYGEEPLSANTAGITYHYSPVNDSLQIFYDRVELAASQTLPTAVLSDILLFEATVDRTSTRG